MQLRGNKHSIKVSKKLNYAVCFQMVKFVGFLDQQSCLQSRMWRYNQSKIHYTNCFQNYPLTFYFIYTCDSKKSMENFSVTICQVKVLFHMAHQLLIYLIQFFHKWFIILQKYSSWKLNFQIWEDQNFVIGSHSNLLQKCFTKTF